MIKQPENLLCGECNHVRSNCSTYAMAGGGTYESRSTKCEKTGKHVQKTDLCHAQEIQQ